MKSAGSMNCHGKIMQGLFLSGLLVLLINFSVHGQMQNQPLNMPTYDHDRVHFGFLLGINVSDFKVQLASDFKTRDSIYVIESNSVSGLNLGILADLKIGNYFDLRFIPALSFVQRNLVYNYTFNDSTTGSNVRKIESTYLEFPLELKYKSVRVNNYRIYVLVGGRYSIDMVSQAKIRTDEVDLIKLNRYDYGYEIGVGFDFYLTYFKFSPELKMYHGLNNLLVREKTSFSSSMESLFSRIFYVSFTFE